MPRSDAKLKTLPEETQAEMWRMRTTPVGEDGQPVEPSKGSAMSQEEVREWLEDVHSVSCSAGSFSDWERWYPLAERFKGAKKYAEDARELLKNTDPDLTIQQLDAYGALAFRKQAFQLDDFEMYQGLRKLAQKDRDGDRKDRKLDQDDRRIRLLEEKAAKADAAEGLAKDESLTDAERGEKLRQEIFYMG